MSARILIIEDEEPLTLLLRHKLEAEGYEVETVARADDVIAAQPLDQVIAAASHDHVIPPRSGEVVGAVGAHDRGSPGVTTPVGGPGGQTGQGDREDHRCCGCDQCEV